MYKELTTDERWVNW